MDELEEKFSFSVWILDAAKRASQLTIASHPSKFSHPDAKTSSIIAKRNEASDGYLRSGNVDFELDVFGNAGALDVYKFLTLKTEDGKTILEHLEINSNEAKEVFNIPNENYETLRQQFLSIKQSDKSIKTDHLVKQVYFLIEEKSYHLLSILTNSGIVSKIVNKFENKVNGISFSEKSKEARECRKNNEHYEGGFDDFFDITVLSYGGTKPRNISILNSQNGGRSYLLPSLPPKIEKRKVNLPNQNFFINVLQIKDFRSDFSKLAKLIKDSRNNKAIRAYRQELIDEIIEKVFNFVFIIRQDFKEGWSNEEKYQKLPLAQKIWLDDFNEQKRNEESDWIDEVSSEFARWIIKTYENLNKKSFEMLGDGNFSYLKNEMIEDITKKTREAIL